MSTCNNPPPPKYVATELTIRTNQVESIEQRGLARKAPHAAQITAKATIHAEEWLLDVP
jgi:hypothetical protein